MSTSFFEKAYKADLEGNLLQAIDNYLFSIRNGEQVLEAYVNFIAIGSVLDIEYGDYCKFFSNDTPQESLPLFSERQQVIEEAKNLFPNSQEIIFWERYVPYYNREIPDLEIMLEAKLMLKCNKEFLQPNFWLYEIYYDSENINDFLRFCSGLGDIYEELYRDEINKSELCRRYYADIDKLEILLMKEPIYQNKHILSHISYENFFGESLKF